MRKTPEYDSDLIIEETFSPNENLIDILVQGRKIIRFTGDDLPTNVVVDNVHDHVWRCCLIASNLDLGANDKVVLQEMLLIHDLPEIENLCRLGRTADMTAPEKMADPDKARLIADLETKVAQEIFTKQEYSLYLRFEAGVHYLKQPYEKSEVDELGALAKIIDTVDANLILHQALSEWAITPGYQSDLLKPGRSLAYAFTQSVVMAVNFNRIGLSVTRSVGLALLEDHLRLIRKMWERVEVAGGRIPDEIEEYV